MTSSTPTGSLVPPSQYLRHAVHRRRLPFGASAPLCSACRLHTTRPQLPQGARQAEHAVCPSSAQTPSWAVQCCRRHEGQTRTCSSHAGCSSTRHWAMPWSLQKSSAQTEQRVEHASQLQWSCRQTTRAVGGPPQCGPASNPPGPRGGREGAFAETDGSAGPPRPASRSRNAPARSSPTLAPAERSYTSLSTTASSTPAPARSTTRATSRPTGCTASFVLLGLAVPSRTGIVSSTALGSLEGGGVGAIRPNERRAARARIASISWERKGLPSTAISAPGSRSSASSDNATRNDSRSLKNGRSPWGKLSLE